MECVLLTTSPKRIETTTSSSHIHLIKILSSVVSYTFIFIPKNLISCSNFSKHVFCFFSVIYIFIWMPLQCQLLVGTLNICS
ncbi:Os01g0977250 [Oryza sativa Japonica Group]|uniref:Os01g0977250 protein n=1 Tax=Oryza sativa subsp. japonica TaxID=39947 RepID=A0A0P0VDM0_ORYSJ|nr:Os01g0977250 [Oryza sativa Japonica Group]